MTLPCQRRARLSTAIGLLFSLFLRQDCEQVDAFVHSFAVIPRGNNPSFVAGQSSVTGSRLNNAASPYYDDYDEDDEDDMIDPDLLGDWRVFRKNLAQSSSGEEDVGTSVSVRASVPTENEEVLSSQNEELAKEYRTGVWAHEVATPEVGGLIVRMPIEVELYRNYRHSIIGQKLRKKHSDSLGLDDAKTWYVKAQALIEEEMQDIASNADENGQIDSTTLSDDSTEMLQIFLDNQESWQEVCLVLEKDEDFGTAKTLVLNRPMAMKLTDHLSKRVIYGTYQYSDSGVLQSFVKVDMVKFMLAFEQECAVYVGGTDDQDQAAVMLHGFKDLPGAREVSPGTGIYEGGLAAAVDGILKGKYKALDFRFFVGCHTYQESTLDVAVVLGKYQPVACARSVALKQCISLPKPLWHEVLELVGGHMGEVSNLEMLKRDDILFQVIEDDEDMFDELRIDDDDDDGFYD